MRLPHPVRFEKLQKDSKIYEGLGIPRVDFESFCEQFFGGLPGEQTFLDYRRSSLGRMPRTGISASDVAYACWRKPRIYMIEEGIGDLLLNTKLGETVELDHFRFPFMTMYLDLPDSEFEVLYRLSDDEVQVAPLEGIYIIEDNEIVLPKDDVLEFVGMNEKLVGETLRPIAFVLVSKPIEGNPHHPSIPMDDCLFTFPMFFKEGPLKPQIEERIDEFIGRKKAETDVEAEVLERNLEHFNGIFEWLVNIMLYITMPKSRVDGGKGNRGIPLKKLEKNKRKRREIPDENVFIVGRGIKISHISKDEPGTSRQGRKGIKKRAHWVSGHYRRVPYGPMKVDGVKIPKDQRPTRTKWILPFPRGEGSDYFRNIFRVTE
jgi:hypothetical protein